MNPKPPGTILQHIYLTERLRLLKPGFFVEIGPGNGDISQILLGMGWSGISFDLSSITVNKLEKRFASEIHNGQYTARNQNYLDVEGIGPVDLVISCMVVEHLDDASEAEFFLKSREVLAPGGMMICLVPSSPKHWGIEDDIAGHFRRYTFQGIENLAKELHWNLLHISGLTFPVSNILLPISNYLVNKAEKQKLLMDNNERTQSSGQRDVKYKTNFPNILGLILNHYTLYPFDILQRIFSRSERSLVIYFEAKPVLTKQGDN